MSNVRSRIFVLAALALLAAADMRAQPTGAVTPIIDIRLRSESVDEQGMSSDAEAVTLRGRLGFETSSVRKTSLLAEADLLWPLATRYDSTVNGKTGFPVVPDPETYELNRVQLANTALPDTHIVVGRQRIILDDQRFVGNVGWRQNEQTFDALRIINESLTNLAIDVTYVDQINRVQGKDSPVGRYHGESYLANVGYALPAGRITAFAYLVDLDEAPADSTRTAGLRFVGNRDIGAVGAAYKLAYAKQRDYADSPLDFKAETYSFELMGTYRRVSLGLGREILTGDGTKGFTTPLATLHIFEGWADKFLTTPPDGIDDRYVMAGYTKPGFGKIEKLSAIASYHTFDAERLPLELGSELDLQLRAEWKRIRAALKYANYEAERFSSDTSKLWAEVELVW